MGVSRGVPTRSLDTNHPWSSEVRWVGFLGDSNGLPETTIITGAQPKAKTSRTRLTRTITLRARFGILFVRSLWNAIHPSNGSLSLTRLARVWVRFPPSHLVQSIRSRFFAVQASTTMVHQDCSAKASVDSNLETPDLNLDH